MTLSIDEPQRRAARVVGFCYLFAMAVSLFVELYARGHLVVSDNAAATARNIMEHERLFRLGIAGYLLVMVSDAALVTALYIILRRIDQSIALFAFVLRVVETVIGVVAALNSFDVLRLLSGAGYLQSFTTDQLQALARIPVSLYGAGLNVSFVFLGLGSAAFGYLWLKSGYIPKSLAILGIFASLLLAAGSFTFIIFPGLTNMIYFIPIFLFEVSMGFLLLLKGLPIGQRAHGAPPLPA
jgi:uncharacterized protein DUF4386